MNIVQRRQPQPEPPAQQQQLDPTVVKFLDDYHKLVRHRDNLGLDNDKLAVDLATERRENEFLRMELSKISRERDEYQRGYNELKVQVMVIATAASSLAATSHESLEAAKNHMIRAGLVPDGGPTEGDDVHVKAIADKFGPRRPGAAAPEQEELA